MNEFYYIARLRIKRREDKGNDYFGRGVADLLHGVDQFSSLNLAARHMGMAYSKAWRIVRQAEAAPHEEKWFHPYGRRPEDA